MQHQRIQLGPVNLFYREAGDKAKPTLILLHGYPSSSHMYRHLIPLLAKQYHVLAPDFPGFGFTQAPGLDAFEYSFDNLAQVTQDWISALKLDHYYLYMQDYGAPVGFRIASQAPEKVRGLIIQNGNAYTEGLTEAWAGIQAYWDDKSPANGNALKALCTQEFIRHMYENGCQDPAHIAPEAWALDSYLMDSSREAIQIALFYDYRNNVTRYPEWHSYFRSHQPATLVVWGLNDMFFSKQGAESYAKDLNTIQYHYYDTGHFALEEHVQDIATAIIDFVR